VFHELVLPRHTASFEIPLSTCMHALPREKPLKAGLRLVVHSKVVVIQIKVEPINVKVCHLSKTLAMFAFVIN